MNMTRKLTVSALVMAIYISLIYVTAGFSFGAYQMRIATALYAMSYFFPFLVIPMGLANFIANFFFGGLGLIDMIGGLIVGILTTGTIVLIKKYNISRWAVMAPILLVPGLLVPLWLSYLLSIPYSVLVVNVLVGQSLPAIVGALLVRVLEPKMRALPLAK